MLTSPTNETTLYGLLAEFASPSELVAAAAAAHRAGYRRMDAFSPMPIEGLSDALGLRKTRLPWLVLCGGIIGGATAFFFQYWVAVIDYPLNIGGRPLDSWPAFIPVTFEMTTLAAAFAAVFGMLGFNRLPMPYHPVFNVPDFTLASRDRFFFCIEAADDLFDLNDTTKFLSGLSPLGVFSVPK
jgi:hypothetical protein